MKLGNLINRQSTVLFLFILLFTIPTKLLFAQTAETVGSEGVTLYWHDPSSWSTGEIPDAGTDVIIKDIIKINGGYDFEVNNLTMDNSEGRDANLKLSGGSARSLHVYGDMYMNATEAVECYLEVVYSESSVVVDGSVYMIKNLTDPEASVNFAPRIRIFSGAMTIGVDLDINIGFGESGSNSVLWMGGDLEHGRMEATLDILGTMKYSTSSNNSSQGMNLYDEAILTTEFLDLDLTGDELSNRDFNVYLYDDAQFIVNQNATISRTGGNRFFVRLGRSEADRDPGEVANVTFQINGDLTLESFNGESTSLDELKILINGTSTFHVGGNLTANSDSERPLQIEANETAAVTIEGDVTLTGSSTDNVTFDFNESSSIEFGGTLTLDFPEGTNTDDILDFSDDTEVTFDNNSSTTIIPEGFTFTNLTVDTQFGMQLSSDITIDGTIDFVKGKLDANGNTVYLTNTSSASMTRNDAETTYPSYVYNGKVNRQMLLSDGGSYLFPVGDLTNGYSPVILEGLDGANGEFEVEYFRGDPGNTGSIEDGSGLLFVGLVEYWDVHKVTTDPGNTIGAKVILTLNDQSSTTGDFNDIPNPSALRVAHWNGVEWENLSDGSAYNAGNQTISSANPLYSFSPLAVGGTDPAQGETLPVELISFTGKISAGSVDLFWKTASELNNDYFSVEKSGDGENFSSIAEIVGNGTTSSMKQYQYSDFNVLSGISYYRLKQIDYDGAYEYSAIISIDTNSINELELYPTPTKDFISISLTESQGTGNITITDIGGQVVYEKTYSDKSMIRIDMSTYNKGLYFLKLASSEIIQTSRIIKE